MRGRLLRLCRGAGDFAPRDLLTVLPRPAAEPTPEAVAVDHHPPRWELLYRLGARPWVHLETSVPRASDDWRRLENELRRAVERIALTPAPPGAYARLRLLPGFDPRVEEADEQLDLRALARRPALAVLHRRQMAFHSMPAEDGAVLVDVLRSQLGRPMRILINDRAYLLQSYRFDPHDAEAPCKSDDQPKP